MEASKSVYIRLDLSHPLYEELKSEYEDHLPLHIARLQALESDKEKEKNLAEIIDLSKYVLSRIDQNSILAYFGMKADLSSDSTTVKSDKEERKSQIITALTKLGMAQATILLDDKDTEGCSVRVEDLDSNMQNLAKFVDLTDSKVLAVSIKHAQVHNYYGRALKLSLKQLEEKATKDLEQAVIGLYSCLGWGHCVRHYSNWILVKYPPAYRPF